MRLAELRVGYKATRPGYAATRAKPNSAQKKRHSENGANDDMTAEPEEIRIGRDERSYGRERVGGCREVEMEVSGEATTAAAGAAAGRWGR